MMECTTSLHSLLSLTRHGIIRQDEPFLISIYIFSDQRGKGDRRPSGYPYCIFKTNPESLVIPAYLMTMPATFSYVAIKPDGIIPRL
jgi:hypothetical protein